MSLKRNFNWQGRKTRASGGAEGERSPYRTMRKDWQFDFISNKPFQYLSLFLPCDITLTQGVEWNQVIKLCRLRRKRNSRKEWMWRWLPCLGERLEGILFLFPTTVQVTGHLIYPVNKAACLISSATGRQGPKRTTDHFTHLSPHVTYLSLASCLPVSRVYYERYLQSVCQPHSEKALQAKSKLLNDATN